MPFQITIGGVDPTIHMMVAGQALSNITSVTTVLDSGSGAFVSTGLAHFNFRPSENSPFNPPHLIFSELNRPTEINRLERVPTPPNLMSSFGSASWIGFVSIPLSTTFYTISSRLCSFSAFWRALTHKPGGLGGAGGNKAGGEGGNSGSGSSKGGHNDSGFNGSKHYRSHNHQSYQGVVFHKRLDQRLGRAVTPVTEPTGALIGMILDVSSSMERHASNHLKSPERWSSSIFRTMDELLKSDEALHNDVFAFGAGAKKDPTAFDLLRTLEGDETVHRVHAKASGYRRSRTTILVGDIMDILDNRGRTPECLWPDRYDASKSDSEKWFSAELATSEVRLEEAGAFLAALEADNDLLKAAALDIMIAVNVAENHDRFPALYEQITNTIKSDPILRRAEGRGCSKGVVILVKIIKKYIKDLNGLESLDEMSKEERLQEEAECNRIIVDKMMEFLEINGAPSVRDWASDAVVASQINFKDSTFLLAAIEEDSEFMHRVVEECLPPICRRSKHWTMKRPQALGGNVLYGGIQKVVPGDIIEAEVRDVRDKAKTLWVELHPPLPIDPNMAVFKGEDALEVLRGRVLTDPNEDLAKERVDELMDEVEPHIYGDKAPLIQTLKDAVKVFETNPEKDKVLFVISTGTPTDGAIPPLEALHRLGVRVISCFVTDQNIQGKRLYCLLDPAWADDAQFMYSLSSSISTQKIPRTIFVQRGWQIDFANNETRLFMQVNNPDVTKDVTQLVRDVVCNQDTLSDLLGSVSLDLFINRVNDEVAAKDQIGGTCYANAAAAVVYMAMKRIYHRQADPLPQNLIHEANGDYQAAGQETGYPFFPETDEQADSENFFLLRKEMIEEFSDPNKVGAHTSKVLETVCPRYRLRSKEVQLVGAMKAISEKQPVVATFQLSDMGWEQFRNFYKQHPRGVLASENLFLHDKGKLRGHAVVLTSYNKTGLRFMNSWGTDWADSGFFTVKRRVLPKLKFYTVFWEEEDLLDSEKRAYRSSGQTVARNLIDKYQGLKNAVYKCPVCLETSPVMEYRGRFDRAICPKCEKDFSTSENTDLIMTLYLFSLCED